MAAKTWKCLMPGCPNRINDPNDQLRDLTPNTCAGCGRWRYLPHSLIAGVAIALIAVVAGIVWLVGMPARSYETKYEAFLRNDGLVDEKEQIELAKVAEKHGLNSETIARIQGDVKQRLGLKPTPQPQSQPTAQPADDLPARASGKELVALIHNIYSDHLKSGDEQQALAAAIQKQRLDPALAEKLEQQIKARWERAQPFFERGLTANKQSRFQTAIEEFQRALSEDGDNAWILANLGAAYLQAGRTEDAEASCQRALEHDPRNWLAHYNLGSHYAKQGRKEAAIDELQRALECVAEDRTQRITRDDVVGQLRTDTSLSSIRQDERFRQLLARY
ncbi:MAG: tetratricopeptide repeat protein [Blastocatellales bacterium]